MNHKLFALGILFIGLYIFGILVVSEALRVRMMSGRASIEAALNAAVGRTTWQESCGAATKGGCGCTNYCSGSGTCTKPSCPTRAHATSSNTCTYTKVGTCSNVDCAGGVGDCYLMFSCNYSSGNCSYTCNTGWQDANNNPADGCETATSVQTCSDGTAYNQCSVTKPKYCSNGTLINKCSQCLCSSGTCQTDGTCSVITSSLVGYWKFDEGTGTTTTDSSGHGNNGTLVNSPTWATGKTGKALSFNSTTQKVDVGNSSTLNPTSAISVQAWIYTKAYTNYPRIISKETTTIADPYALELTSSNNIRFFVGDGATETGTPDINVTLLNTWVHVVGTYDGQNIKIYINGVLKGQTPKTGAIPLKTTKVLIGSNPSSNRSFNGTIDDVKVWNKALTASEVLSEYGGAIQACSDGTPYSSCSSTKPLYCSSGTLINKCSQCGCSSGTCQSDGSCSVVVEGNCSSLTYPTSKWQGVWYIHSTGVCLGNGPDETSQTFDENWGTGIVAYNRADDIEFRSSRTINFPTAGNYTFTLGSDDGVRLWIDDVLRIDKWVDRSYTADSFILSMTAGTHRFRIDYYENGGGAKVSFSYTAPVATCTSCGTWTNGACNAGGCTNQRQQTRTCTPTGCTPSDGLGTSRCVADSICGTAAQYINITENSVGTVPKLTWGANIVSSSNFDTLYNSISQSGVTLLRTDIDLNFIFPTATSTPNFSRLDKMISTAKKIGIEPLIIVDYTPAWLSKNTSSTKYPPTDMTKFNSLVAAVVNHVKDNVTYYEIWNEPDSTKFWNGTAAEYGSLLRNVSQTIRSIDSNAKILAPAFSEVYAFDSKLALLQEVCKNENSYFDIVSFHTYIFYKISLSGWLGDMNDFTQKLNQYGCSGKQIWMTEAGIFNEFLSRDYRDVLKVATIRKALLDYNSNAQVYYPFLSHSDVGTDVGLYDSSVSQFTNIGKYYQLVSQLKFYGNKTDAISNVQNNVSGISYLSVRNPDNKIIIQLTNNFSTSKDVQINFQNVKNITVYESSSSQVFNSPLAEGLKSSFHLSLKQYSVYLIEAKSP
jgi:O-glycosyl hydrolase